MLLHYKIKKLTASVLLAVLSINLFPCQVVAVREDEEGGLRSPPPHVSSPQKATLETHLLEEGDKASSNSTSAFSCLPGLKPLLTRSGVRESIEMDNVVEAPSTQSVLSFPAVLRQLGLSEEALQSSPALRQLLALESSAFRSWARWKTADHLLQKALYGVVLNPESHLTSDAEKPWWPTKRHWVQGQAMPLERPFTMRRAYFIDGFRKGVETMIMAPFHYGLPALTLYHVIELLKPQYQCGVQVTSPPSLGAFFSSIWNSDEESLSGIFHSTVGNDSVESEVIKALVFALPLTWGIGNGMLRTFVGTTPAEDAFLEHVKKLSERQASFWNDWLSILPFHPLAQNLATIQKRLLWDGSLLKEVQDKAFAAMVGLLTHAGYTRILTIEALSHLAYTAHIRDLRFLKEKLELSDGAIQQWLSLKARAFEDLQKQAESKKVEKRKVLYALYARYLLWSLGFCSDPREWMAWTAFKGAKLYVQVRLIVSIVQNFLDALHCPAPGGYSFTGPEPWASDYSQTCFDAYIKQLGRVPAAQSAQVQTLINLLPRFYLNCFLDLDLSNKGLSGESVFQFLEQLLRLQPLITLRSLNLSGNAINKEEDFERAAILLPFFSQLHTLDLSSNSIGYTSSNATVSLGKNLSALHTLRVLNLSSNFIGYRNSFGVIAMGQALTTLTNLASLDLSKNLIGNMESNGTVVLGKTLGVLTQLTFLNLSRNAIGSVDSYGTLALGNALSAWEKLTVLDLSSNSIGGTDSNGTVALGNALSTLKNLRFLDLSKNKIGYKDSHGTVALGNGLANHSKLTFLDLSENLIGFEGSLGIQALAQTLTSLSNLQQFLFVPQQTAISPTWIETFNRALQRSPVQLAVPLPTLYTASEIGQFLQELDSNTTAILLSRVFFNPSAALMKALFQGLQNFPNITSLTLSGNNIGLGDLGGSVALGEGLRTLTQLTSLDLSDNGIGLRNSKGTVALGNALSVLPNLISLDLSANWIGNTDSNGTVVLSNALSTLKNLEYLDLSANFIGNTDSNGTVVLSNSLSILKNLEYLDLSANKIGKTDSQGTVALGNALSALLRLKFLSLSNNNIDATDDRGSCALGKALYVMTALKNLQLCAFSEFCTVTEDCYGGGCYIGTHGGAGASLIVEALRYLPNLKALAIEGFTNISAPGAAKPLNALYVQQLQESCQSELCYADQTAIDILTPHWIELLSQQNIQFAVNETAPLTPQSSASSRLSSPFWIPPIKAAFRGTQSLWKALTQTGNALLDWSAQAVVRHVHETIEGSPSYFPYASDNSGRLYWSPPSRFEEAVQGAITAEGTIHQHLPYPAQALVGQ